jgi:hypothetical protein
MSDDFRLETLIVTPEGFPHGLRCMDCNEVIPNGDAYAHRATDNPEIAEIVCLSCGLAEVTP